MNFYIIILSSKGILSYLFLDNLKIIIHKMEKSDKKRILEVMLAHKIIKKGTYYWVHLSKEDDIDFIYRYFQYANCEVPTWFSEKYPRAIAPHIVIDLAIKQHLLLVAGHDAPLLMKNSRETRLYLQRHPEITDFDVFVSLKTYSANFVGTEIFWEAGCEADNCVTAEFL